MPIQLTPPAGLPELQGLEKAWTRYLSEQFDLEIKYIRSRYDPGQEFGGRLPVQYANPAEQPVPPHAQLHAVSWNGFPRRLQIQQRAGELDALATAEQPLSSTDVLFTGFGTPVPITYRQGDEYLEWLAEERDGRLQRITFSCESPDYWMMVAQGHASPFFMIPDDSAPAPSKQPPKSAGKMQVVVDSYRRLVNARVEPEDLVFDQDMYDGQKNLIFRKNSYNPWNKWNTTHGIMHLSNPANTLGEEIEICGDGTVLRHGSGGRLLQAAKCLLCCGGFGNINRSSDPAIGAAVNELARGGYTLTIADPVGLYMSHLDTSGWTTPDGSPVDARYWRVIRGSAGTPGQAGSTRTVRAVLEVPDGETWNDNGTVRRLQVGDLRIGGQRIRYAGQVADAVRMVVVLAVWPDAGPKPRSIGCEPEYRCCRTPGSHEFILLTQGDTDGKRVAGCAAGQVDAYPTTTRSADQRSLLLKKLAPPDRAATDAVPGAPGAAQRTRPCRRAQFAKA